MRFIVLLVPLWLAGAALARDIAATTEEGKKVLLKQDGTWTYLDQGANSRATSLGRTAQASAQVRSKKGFATVWYNPSAWRLDGNQKINNEAEFAWQHESGDAYAMAIIERIPIPLDTLRTIALENAQRAAPGAQIVYEEAVEVEGEAALILDIEGNLQGIAFRYHGLYWSSDKGAIQLVTFTSQNLFDELKPSLDDLLSGLEIRR
jgi:hypothetical protein